MSPPPPSGGVKDSNREEVRGCLGRVAGDFGVQCGYGSDYTSAQYHYGRSRHDQHCDDTGPNCNSGLDHNSGPDHNDDSANDHKSANNHDPAYGHSCRHHQ